MYVGVSNSQIMPGLEMLGKLSLMNHQRGVGGQKDILLSTYLRNSQSSINNIADKVSVLSRISHFNVSLGQGYCLQHLYPQFVIYAKIL